MITFNVTTFKRERPTNIRNSDFSELVIVFPDDNIDNLRISSAVDYRFDMSCLQDINDDEDTHVLSAVLVFANALKRHITNNEVLHSNILIVMLPMKYVEAYKKHYKRYYDRGTENNTVHTPFMLGLTISFHTGFDDNIYLVQGMPNDFTFDAKVRVKLPQQ